MEECGSVSKRARSDIDVEVVEMDLETSSESMTANVTTATTLGNGSPIEKLPSDFVIVDAWEPEQDADEPQCFVWDAEPNLSSTTSEVPLYKSTFSSVLLEFDEEKSSKNNSKKSAPSRNSCFNCLGDHIMNDCPKPRDFQAISKNRREFMNKCGGFNKQNSRYHLGDDQVYANLKAGQLSNELRKALNLSENQLPRHIYKMRQLGYPPAWLEEAKVSASGMAMFSSQDDVNSKEEDAFVEKYDIDKIIDFPGFNVDPDPGTKDDWRHLHFSPMSSRNSKAEMIKYLQHLNDSAEHRKRRRSPKPDLDDLIVIDQLEEDSEKDDRTGGSPSLADLETQKQLLMAELEGANNSMHSDPPTTPSTPNSSLKIGEVKHIELGTPILKSASPYSRIPAADNFSQGVCDVINFENLPGATGHYSRMNDVIHKIRKSTSNREDKSATAI